MPNWATQIFSREFDAALDRIPTKVRELILKKITEMGSRLESFPHCRMTSQSEFRLRVGDYRIIYRFDMATEDTEEHGKSIVGVCF